MMTDPYGWPGAAGAEGDTLRLEFETIYDQWFTEIGAADTDFFRHRLDAQWLYVDVLGAVRTKDQYLDYIAGISASEPTNTMTDFAVRLIAPFALVHGTYEVDPDHAPPGSPSLITRFTALWERTEDGWIAHWHQSTPVLGV